MSAYQSVKAVRERPASHQLLEVHAQGTAHKFRDIVKCHWDNAQNSGIFQAILGQLATMYFTWEPHHDS